MPENTKEPDLTEEDPTEVDLIAVRDMPGGLLTLVVNGLVVDQLRMLIEQYDLTRKYNAQNNRSDEAYLTVTPTHITEAGDRHTLAFRVRAEDNSSYVGPDGRKAHAVEQGERHA